MAELRIVETENFDHSDWLVRTARAGYAVKGLTYMLLAFLAARAGLGNGQPEDTRGALQQIDGPAPGDLVVLAIAAGLAAYAFWKLYTAIANPENDEVWKRAGAVVIALVNGGLAVEAARIGLANVAGEGSSNQAAHWSALVMAQPAGIIAVGAVGAGMAAYGVARIVKAFKAKLDDQLELGRLDPGTHRLVVSASRIGIAARGFVFILVGAFLIRAALRVNPSDAKDFGHSLQELERAPFGPPLLVAVAVGLLMYGVYQIVRAKYRRFVT